MNASQLKAKIEASGHEAYFFDRATMRFFGDTMRNFGVRASKVRTEYDEDGNYVAEGVVVDVWVLYRHHAVKHGNNVSYFFDAKSFRRVHGEEV